ncbi:nucleotidyltransferase domain-containing protein [Alkalihalobacillus sp. LMS39]|uniref:type VII toxin-antitoxin system MntA family adenylyltransferase antitoxin n=1 Tax=Alkalihalobacillus sp. LMS39 TaxID=2924032 RepID=UPI001FB1BBE4|nr:nucleotidyltransferase domain-containing protein [Alkalihalobacillus sp. LMS39]UOE94083.1 nucleotidyltransferase domain-containing protein [Alkalihalobacillus sp. LMS39]
MLTEDMKIQMIELLQKETNPDFVILFGSFAKETAREESDVDLAYFSEKQLSSYERYTLANHLALICERDIDLVDIREIDTIFAMQIFEQGVPIYIRNEDEYTRQTIKAYRMYAELSEQREVVIEQIKKRGSVFGNE